MPLNNSQIEACAAIKYTIPLYVGWALPTIAAWIECNWWAVPTLRQEAENCLEAYFYQTVSNFLHSRG